MSHIKKLSAVLTAIAALVVVGAMTDSAEARRGFRYRAAPAARYWNPYASGRYGRAYRAPVRYRSAYRGLNRGYGYGGYRYGGYGGVTVGGPRFGVSVGF